MYLSRVIVVAKIISWSITDKIASCLHFAVQCSNRYPLKWDKNKKKKKTLSCFSLSGDKRMKENLSGRIHFLDPGKRSRGQLEKALKTQPCIKSVNKGTATPPAEAPLSADLNCFRAHEEEKQKLPKVLTGREIPQEYIVISNMDTVFGLIRHSF